MTLTFNLDYVPGEFRILFRAVGFFPYTVSLNIAAKSYFPLEEAKLKPVPVLVDIFGKPIENASLIIKKGMDKPSNLDEQTNSRGEYTFDYFQGDGRIGFKKAGFRSDFYSLNLTQKEYPEVSSFILCPDKFGLYMKDMYIPPVEYTHVKPRRPKHTGGGLYIPRVISSWEGEYFLNQEPVSLKNGKNSFFLFPTSVGRLGGGGDPLESVPGLYLLKVNEDNKIAEFGPNGGVFNQINCKMDTVLKRKAFYSGGLASQRINVYRIDIDLPPGKYAFCQFEKPPLNKYFVPGKHAYLFQIGNTYSSNPVTAKTRCNTDQSNLKFAIYSQLFKASIEFDIENTYKSIEGIIEKNTYYDNVLNLVKGYFLLNSLLNDETTIELMCDALSSVGYISGIFGVNDYLPIVSSFLSAALKTIAKPTPESIATYVATNSLSLITSVRFRLSKNVIAIRNNN